MGKSRTSGISKTTSGIGIGGGGGMISGGGASTSAGGASVQAQVQQNQQQNQLTTQVNAQDLIDASKVASIYGNNTSAMFDNMTDSELANALKISQGKVDMPNHIGDISNATQNFTYANKLNAKPTVLSDSDFDNFLKQNGIPDSQILIREVNGATFNSGSIRYNLTANDITDMFKTSDINYIGGKRGGQAYGAGTYFGMEGRNGSTGYASGATMMAVLNPKTARVISYSDINSKWNNFVRNKPNLSKQASNLGSGSRDWSIKALMMGYNVITSDSNGSSHARGEYYNIIDRSAVVVRANNR